MQNRVNPFFGDDFNNEQERTNKKGFKPKTKPLSTKLTTLATQEDFRTPGPATVQGERAQVNR